MRASEAKGSAAIPTPRTSINPASARGDRAHSDSSSAEISHRSSATSNDPCAMRRSARSDFPAPLPPSSRMPASAGAPNAAPAGPSSTQLAWMLIDEVMDQHSSLCPSSERKLDNEAGARLVFAAVLGPNTPTQALRDLTCDGESKTGVPSKAMLGRPLRVEAVEDRFQHLRWNPGAIILDSDTDICVVVLGNDGHRSTFGTERYGVVDEIAENLSQPLVLSQHFGAQGELDCECEVYPAWKWNQAIDFNDRLHKVRHVDGANLLAA